MATFLNLHGLNLLGAPEPGNYVAHTLIDRIYTAALESVELILKH